MRMFGERNKKLNMEPGKEFCFLEIRLVHFRLLCLVTATKCGDLTVCLFRCIHSAKMCVRVNLR